MLVDRLTRGFRIVAISVSSVSGSGVVVGVVFRVSSIGCRLLLILSTNGGDLVSSEEFLLWLVAGQDLLLQGSKWCLGCNRLEVRHDFASPDGSWLLHRSNQLQWGSLGCDQLRLVADELRLWDWCSIGLLSGNGLQLGCLRSLNWLFWQKQLLLWDLLDLLLDWLWLFEDLRLLRLLRGDWTE